MEYFMDSEEPPYDDVDGDVDGGKSDPDSEESPYGDVEGDVYDRTWSEVFLPALLRPKLEAYRELLQTSDMSLGRAALWIFVAYIIYFVLNVIAQSILGSSFLLGQNTETTLELTSNYYCAMIVCSPAVAGLGVMFWFMGVGIIHQTARVLGGVGSFNQLAFLTAAYHAPLLVLFAPLSFAPQVSLYVAVPVSIYTTVLAVISINATHQFGWFKAVISYFLVPIILAGMVGCALILFAPSTNSQPANDILRTLVTSTPPF